MKIKIIEGFPQQKEDAMSKMHPWMMKHHLFVNLLDTVDNRGINLFIEDAEEAKELAQELLHCYNKLMHWIEKRAEND